MIKYDFAPVNFHSHALRADREQTRWGISALSGFIEVCVLLIGIQKFLSSFLPKNDAASQLCYSSSHVAVEVHLNALAYVIKHNCSNHLLCYKIKLTPVLIELRKLIAYQ